MRQPTDEALLASAEAWLVELLADLEGDRQFEYHGFDYYDRICSEIGSYVPELLAAVSTVLGKWIRGSDEKLAWKAAAIVGHCRMFERLQDLKDLADRLPPDHLYKTTDSWLSNIISQLDIES